MSVTGPVEADVPAVQECTTSWHCVNGSDVPVHMSRTLGDVSCCIFHMPTTEVEFGGVVAFWGLYDAAKLSCGHTFNVCAIALHFITNAMTCPVCRAGLKDPMCVKSVPLDIQNLVATVLHKDADVADGVILNFDPADIATDLRLYVSSNEEPGLPLVFLSTTLQETSETGIDLNFHMYRTHRSFQRHFNTLVRQYHESDTPVYLSIQHPLLEQPLSSELFTLDTFTTDVELEILENVIYAHTYNFGGLTRLLIQIDTDRLFNVIVQAVVRRLS